MRRGLAFQLFRKAVQLSSLGFVFYAGLLLHWRNFKVAHNSSRLVALMTTDAVGELYWRNEQLLSLFGEPIMNSPAGISFSCMPIEFAMN